MLSHTPQNDLQFSYVALEMESAHLHPVTSLPLWNYNIILIYKDVEKNKMLSFSDEIFF